MDSMTIVLLPPVALAILVLACAGLSLGLSRLAYRAPSQAAGTTMPYSCGETLPTHMIQPDYRQFFPFAFFFTILHVVALMATTVPSAMTGTFVIAIVYVLGAFVGLSVLYRK
jgi:NADH-quinone oxidoreductase subunit A